MQSTQQFTRRLSFTGINSFFYYNHASFGGAIYTSDNVLFNFNASNDFGNNSAGLLGGAVYARSEVVLSLNGNNNSDHNLAGYGGAIYIFTGSSNFY